MKKKLWASLVAAVYLYIPAIIYASEPLPVGVAGDGWHSWSMNLDETRPPRHSHLTQEEFSKLLGIIQSIGMLFRQIPELNPPQGVEVVPSRSNFKRLEDGPIIGEFFLSIYRPVYRHGNPRCTIQVIINNPWANSRVVLEDSKGPVYLQWPSVEGREKWINYQTARDTVLEILLPEGRSPWVPVSQERWIKALIRKSEAQLETQLKDITDGSARRREQFMRGYRTMQNLNPEQAVGMLEAFESSEEVYRRQADTPLASSRRE